MNTSKLPLMSCFAAMCLCAAATPLFASSLVPIAQNRRVFADAFGSGVNGFDQDLQHHEAPDLLHYGAVLHALFEDPVAIAAVTAWQDSIIGPCALIAAGGFEGTSITEPGAVFSYAEGIVDYDVTFSVDEATPFELTGDAVAIQQTQVRVQLISNGQTQISDIIEDEKVEYNFAGVLQPGQHRVLFRAIGVSSTTPPDSMTRGSFYRLQLRTCGPKEDITGDGVVDVFDLFMLLGAWGECPGPAGSDCLSDLDGSHSVDVFDLFELLSNWGG